jgi:hypothetical protein
MKKLVDQVLAGQSPGVEDRRGTARVVCENPDQAVAHAALLIADGQDGDLLQLDLVVA